MQRRDFLRNISAGGTLVAGGALLSACESSTGNNNDDDLDATIEIVTNGANFEAMGIQTYVAAANSGLLVDQAVIDAALAFMADHEAHLDEMNALLRLFDREEISADGADPDPGVGAVTNQQDILELALNVEFQAASFYFSGIVNTVRNADVLRGFANILPVEVAHMVTYKNVLGLAPAIDGSIFEQLSSGL